MSTEKPIQRYDLSKFGGEPVMQQSQEGHYITFFDHEKALAEQQAKTEVELARGEQWCADFIAMRKERDQLQSALASEYGRGVTAGKLEAGKYTPEEREAYGKHVAHADEWTGLKNRLAEVAAERDRLKAEVARMQSLVNGNIRTAQTAMRNAADHESTIEKLKIERDGALDFAHIVGFGFQASTPGSFQVPSADMAIHGASHPKGQIPSCPSSSF